MQYYKLNINLWFCCISRTLTLCRVAHLYCWSTWFWYCTTMITMFHMPVYHEILSMKYKTTRTKEGVNPIDLIWQTHKTWVGCDTAWGAICFTPCWRACLGLILQEVLGSAGLQEPGLSCYKLGQLGLSLAQGLRLINTGSKKGHGYSLQITIIDINRTW